MDAGGGSAPGKQEQHEQAANAQAFREDYVGFDPDDHTRLAMPDPINAQQKRAASVALGGEAVDNPADVHCKSPPLSRISSRGPGITLWHADTAAAQPRQSDLDRRRFRCRHGRGRSHMNTELNLAAQTLVLHIGTGSSVTNQASVSGLIRAFHSRRVGSNPCPHQPGTVSLCTSCPRTARYCLQARACACAAFLFPPLFLSAGTNAPGITCRPRSHRHYYGFPPLAHYH